MCFTSVREEQVYLNDYRTTLVIGKTLALSDVLRVSSIRVNLIFVALLGKVGVKVQFEYDKIVMTKKMCLWKRDIVIKVFLY